MRLENYLNENNIKDWTGYINNNKMLKSAVKVLQTINKKGFKCYIVGGCVRDIVLGIQPHDIDICTNMPMDRISKLYKTHDIGKSKQFGIVVIKQGSYNFEIAQFRQDGTYKDGRRPDTVKISSSFKDDAKRRDFQINAMAIDKDGNIIDYFNGKKDIKNKVLKTVGDPNKRFGEDYLRMLRAARFSAKLDFDIEPKTKKAIKKSSYRIQDLSPERIKDEIMKAASQSGDVFAKYLNTLDELNLLKYIFPEIMNLKWFKENMKHHPETSGYVRRIIE